MVEVRVVAAGMDDKTIRLFLYVPHVIILYRYTEREEKRREEKQAETVTAMNSSLRTLMVALCALCLASTAWYVRWLHRNSVETMIRTT